MPAFVYCSGDGTLTFMPDRFADMMERSSLRAAQSYAVQAEMLVDQAQRVSPEVKSIPSVHIAQGLVSSSHILGDPAITRHVFQFFVR